MIYNRPHLTPGWRSPSLPAAAAWCTSTHTTRGCVRGPWSAVPVGGGPARLAATSERPTSGRGQSSHHGPPEHSQAGDATVPVGGALCEQ